MAQTTYCNPLSISDIPSGHWLDTATERMTPDACLDFRSISDPSVIYHDGKWILYPSYAVAYVTEDFVHWKHVDIGIPHLRYSPAVVQFRGKWYLAGHSMSELYCADDPLGPFTLCGHFTDVNGRIIKPVDACFLADGDRLYMYCYGSNAAPDGVDAEGNRVSCTVGVELDPERPWQFLHERTVINQFDPAEIWQRTGEDNQNARRGWIEGQWMKKIGGRYYLLYCGSGTQYSSYANGIAVSDEGPLSGFRPQKNHNPFTRKRYGLVRGAGHGCLVDGPGGTLWVFYTSIFCFNHKFERRIGMDPVGIDENGELYCPEVTETPQFAPGVLTHPEKGNGTGWGPVTFMQRPTATSHVPGREPLYASDESVLTWWQPSDNDPAPMITFQLGNQTRYNICGVRLIWRDIGMDTLAGIDPGPFRYVVEYAPAADLAMWETLIDASENTDDLCIDYREVTPVKAYGIRLRILGAPAGITPGLVSLTAFGNAVREIP